MFGQSSMLRCCENDKIILKRTLVEIFLILQQCCAGEILNSIQSFPLATDIKHALHDFAMLAKNLSSSSSFDGDLPVTTPELSGVTTVACVYADPHKDLPHPRFGVLAPILLGRSATLCIKDGLGRISRRVLSMQEMIVFDSHQEHWVDKPVDYPQNWNDLSLDSQKAYIEKNLLVFANRDFNHQPTLEQCEHAFRAMLCLPKPTMKRKCR